MYCRYCGKSIPEDSVFCSFCGQATENASINIEKGRLISKIKDRFKKADVTSNSELTPAEHQALFEETYTNLSEDIKSKYFKGGRQFASGMWTEMSLCAGDEITPTFPRIVALYLMIAKARDSHVSESNIIIQIKKNFSDIVQPDWVEDALAMVDKYLEYPYMYNDIRTRYQINDNEYYLDNNEFLTYQCFSNGEEIVQLEGTVYDDEYQLAASFYKDAEYWNAIHKFEECLELNPIGIAARFGIIDSYINLNKIDKAKENIIELSKYLFFSESYFSRYYKTLGYILTEEENYECAFACYYYNFKFSNKDDMRKCMDSVETLAHRQIIMSKPDTVLSRNNIPMLDSYIPADVTANGMEIIMNKKRAVIDKRKKSKRKIFIGISITLLFLFILIMYSLSTVHKSPIPIMNKLFVNTISEFHNVKFGMGVKDVLALVSDKTPTTYTTGDNEIALVFDESNKVCGLNSPNVICVFNDAELTKVLIYLDTWQRDSLYDEYTNIFGEPDSSSYTSKAWECSTLDVSISYVDNGKSVIFYRDGED